MIVLIQKIKYKCFPFIVRELKIVWFLLLVIRQFHLSLVHHSTLVFECFFIDSSFSLEKWYFNFMITPLCQHLLGIGFCCFFSGERIYHYLRVFYKKNEFFFLFDIIFFQHSKTLLLLSFEPSHGSTVTVLLIARCRLRVGSIGKYYPLTSLPIFCE